MFIRLAVIPWRGFSTSRIYHGVDKTLLSKLRKKTGFPFIKCKNALEQHDNDIQKAETWLRDQAQKEGWAKATKLQDRPMSQGLIGLIKDNNVAAMVEINCETDFVSRNAKFRELVAKSTTACLIAGKKSMTAKVEWDKDAVNEIVLEDGRTLADVVAMEVGNLGENMLLRRGVFMSCVDNDDSVIGHYIHTSGVNVKEKQCLLGKFGALVSLVHERGAGSPVPPMSRRELEDMGRQLSQHVVGMNPSQLGYADTKDKKAEAGNEWDLGAKEEEKETMESKACKLVFQEFLHDPTMTAGEYMQSKHLHMIDFVRFECGEAGEAKED